MAEFMTELIEGLGSWHWLVLGLVLLIAEALGAGGFLIGAAVAAFALAGALWYVPGLSVGFQLGMYAVTAVVATWAYLQVFRGMAESDTAGELLNQRGQQLIGTVITLDEGVMAGAETRVQIGDTRWRARADGALTAGSKVRVVGTSVGDDMRLEVRPIDG